MTTYINQALAFILLILLIFLVVIYLLRVGKKGRAEFRRVEQDGGSVFLSARLMEMGYWSIQPLARLIVLLRIHPNHVTFSAMGFALLAAIAFLQGMFGVAALAALLAGLCDALDGLVSRITGKGTPAGQVLDSSVDRAVEFLCLGGIILYWRMDLILLVIGLLALFGAFMVSYSTAKAEALGVLPPRGNMKRAERAFLIVLGAFLSAILSPEFFFFLPVDVQLLERNDLPLMICISLIAIFGNLSAVQRLTKICKQVNLKERDEEQKEKKSVRRNVERTS
jgi:CDP-diacylglycerol---glycerol-3-phosphate 3-phosphatidyltransferase